MYVTRQHVRADPHVTLTCELLTIDVIRINGLKRCMNGWEAKKRWLSCKTRLRLRVRVVSDDKIVGTVTLKMYYCQGLFVVNFICMPCERNGALLLNHVCAKE